MLVSVHIPLKAHPWCRPEQGKGRRYTKACCSAYRSHVASILRSAYARRGQPKFTGEVTVTVWITGLTARDGDVDNLAKNLLDAITLAKWWKDDRQVSRLVVQRLPGVGYIAPYIRLAIEGE